MSNVNKKKIRIFGCGGAGINIVSNFVAKVNENVGDDGADNLLPYFIDTSDSNISNINNSINNSNKGKTKIDGYLIDGLDGSGQKRDLNASVISDNIKSILLDLELTDLIVVVHSLSGGSGSVIAPLLAKELISNGRSVVVLGIGDTSTGKFTDNTLATLKTYENISNKIGKPINMIYHHNSLLKPDSDQKVSRKQVDGDIMNSLINLYCLGAFKYIGLDTKDIEHFLNYNTVTDYEPKLSLMSILTDKKDSSGDYDSTGSIISAITLHSGDVNIDLHETPEVQYIGEDKDSSNSEGNGYVNHYIITDGFYDKLAETIKNYRSKLDEKRAAKPSRKSILDSGDSNTESDDNGLIF